MGYKEKIVPKELIIESKKHGTHTVLIDEEDWEKVKGYTWSLSIKKTNTFYAKTQIKHPSGESISCKRDGKRPKVTTLQMHRLIMDPIPDGMQVDHVNHNGLDNRNKNLRICTSQQNTWNAQKPKLNRESSSQYKGVSWYKRYNKWVARGTHDGKRITLGYYNCEKEAARAYDAAAKELHGEYAHLNFPDKEKQ